MVYYEVWHRASTRDRSGGFCTQTEALAALRGALAAHGPAYLQEFSLVRVDTRECRTVVAEGPLLVSRVESCGLPA